MMKILYYDCFSGISGDMNLGAMLDLGVDPAYLLGELKKVNIDDSYEIRISREKRRGIEGTRFEVLLQTHDHSHQHRTYSDIARLLEESGVSARAKNTGLNIFRKVAEAEAKVHGCDVEEVHFS